MPWYCNDNCNDNEGYRLTLDIMEKTTVSTISIIVIICMAEISSSLVMELPDTTHQSNFDLKEVELTRDSTEVQGEEFETPRPFLLEPETHVPVSSPSSVTDSIRNSTDNMDHIVGTETCLCGRSIAKIVGGENARINDLPWTALLYKRGFFGGRSPYCGATLINNLYVLTASHCVDGMGIRGIEVVLKEENLSTTEESKSFTFAVSKIIMHPKYSRKTIDNDIALLKLATPVELSANGPFVPACVPKNNDQSYAGETATVAGWGATRQGGSVSKVLKRVDVPIISNDECDMTKYMGKITPNMLCAGNIKEGGKDSCQGDSGGPLVLGTNKRKIIVGVVSWGYGCAKPNSPGVYSRVSKYTDWIVSETDSDATWCNE